MKISNVFGGLVLATAGIATGAQAQALDKVIFAKAAPWGIIDAQIAFAVELGYFKEERIDPVFIVVGGSYAAVQQILAGTAQTGYVSTETLPTALQPGATPLPMKMVYNYLRTPIFEMVVLPNSPVQKLADLKGKKIGVLSLTTGNVPVTKAAMGAVGVAATDFTMLPVGAGPQSVQALTSGQIDALNLWHTLHEQMNETGVPIRRVTFPAEFETFPSTALGFSDAYIKSNPDVVARYGRAFTKGTVACRANPTGCVQALWRQYPTTKPSGDEAAALASARRIIEPNFKRLFYFRDGVERFGAYDSTDWANLLKAFKAGGALAETNIPLDKVYTNQFVAEYNKFDKAAVEAAARAYK